MNEHQIALLVGLYRSGASLEEIRHNAGMTEEEFNAFWATVDLSEPTDEPDEPSQLRWTEAQINQAVDDMIPVSIIALQEIITNPNTPAATRLKAAEDIQALSAELQERKKPRTDRAIMSIIIDERFEAAVERLIEELNRPDLDDVMDEQTGEMPNT